MWQGMFSPYLVDQLKYMEQDYSVIAEKLDKEKESHAATARDLHVRLSSLARMMHRENAPC